jgi:predicted dehydrogenase
MAVRQVGIIVNGASGRIGSSQHLANSLVPIRDAGGLACGDDRIVPKLLLVARNPEKLAGIAQRHGIEEWTTDLDAALARPDYSVFLDAAATRQRVETLHKAIAAGKHIYSEKPVAPTVAEGLALLQAAEAKGLKHGAVEDKIYLPGFQKLLGLMRDGFFGRVTGFRLDFGWWVFDGIERASQRPSWNYRSSGGGGMTSDMYPHWRYLIEDILGPIRRVVTTANTAVRERADESGNRFAVDVDDSAMTLVELAGGAAGTIVSSWATRVRGDDVLTLQVDGTGGSAVASVHRCWAQSGADTPVVQHINPDVDSGADFRSDWKEVAGAPSYSNPYRRGWEAFLRHVVAGTPLRADLRAGIRDVQLVDACYRSVAEKKWIDIDAPMPVARQG